MMHPREAVDEAVDEAFAAGLFQHDGEIRPFAHWLNLTVKPRRILEIGRWRGGSTLLWSRLVGSLGLVVSIDKPMGEFGGADCGIDEPTAATRDYELRRRTNATLCLYRGDSHDPKAFFYAADREFGQYDLLFIDGDHRLAGVRQDWEWYRWLVRPGGVVAFHDIVDTPFHRERHVEVPTLWNELTKAKLDLDSFSVREQWGGIGVVRCSAEGWR